jgi:hypothetical protein
MAYQGWKGRLASAISARFATIEAVYNFDLGDEFEIAVAGLLREFLPARYGVCRGFVVSAGDALAGDDIIVYDRAAFPRIRGVDEDLGLKEKIPAEAVVAYIEAKHRLDLTAGPDVSNSLAHACAQIAAVKGLVRRQLGLNSLTSTVTLAAPLQLQVQSGFPNIKNPWYAAIFARHVEHGNAGQDLAQALVGVAQGTPKDRMPDTCVAGQLAAFPVLPLPGGIVQIRPFLCASTTYATIHPGETAFAMTVMHLAYALEQQLCAPLDWQQLIAEGLPGIAVVNLPLNAAPQP